MKNIGTVSPVKLEQQDIRNFNRWSHSTAKKTSIASLLAPFPRSAGSSSIQIVDEREPPAIERRKWWVPGELDPHYRTGANGGCWQTRTRSRSSLTMSWCPNSTAEDSAACRTAALGDSGRPGPEWPARARARRAQSRSPGRRRPRASSSSRAISKSPRMPQNGPFQSARSMGWKSTAA